MAGMYDMDHCRPCQEFGYVGRHIEQPCVVCGKTGHEAVTAHTLDLHLPGNIRGDAVICMECSTINQRREDEAFAADFAARHPKPALLVF